ncbi:ATP-binding cassette subfamily F protein uup [Rhizomicrobium palustre]|uniref:ATP-binding protein Uup n=1 Tax=Rhizomicrobium palustre TaxID=189966 RepID=A0A846N420_9PROT|nr:ATP-binding cassette domain-containing protein [Rhizomicrobium palustre]NIK89847.1 ATP-binding cassette subfamily F protein uup [Rhizomicrobium palustre]
MPAPLLTLQDVRLTIGTSPLLDGAELFVEPGDRICLVGRNGSGKSTLLKIAAGMLEPDAGRRFAQPGATIRYLPQEPDLSGYPDAFHYVAAGLSPGDGEARAHYLLGKLGLTGEEDVTTLSGGQARRAALARVLAPRPDILLLDEPTNHLDLPAIEWLQEELESMPGALVLISHDRRFLTDLSRATIWLDRGKTRRTDRGFGIFESWRDQLLEEEERDRQKLNRKIAAEEHWVRYGVTARRKRNVRRMAGLAELRQQKREARRQLGQVNFQVSEAANAGTRVIEANNISKAYGDKQVVKDFSTRILRGDRIGLIGANGAGKTTLLNLLTGRLKPDSGFVQLGTNLVLVNLDQTRTLLDSTASLKEVLTDGRGDRVEVGGEWRHVTSYMKDFLFTPEQAGTSVNVLSGGERARLLLAKVLAKPGNLLVLDEPTNDLDLETLDLLEEMIDDYPGTVLLVSHDRDFLDRTVTAVLFAEGNGSFTEYAGGYSDMMAQRGGGVEATRLEKAEKKEKAVPRVKADAPKRKLSFNEKHALEKLPGEIDKLTAQIDKLQSQLNDPKAYQDSKKFAELTAALGKAEAERSAAEDRWLELEALREELEGK